MASKSQNPQQIVLEVPYREKISRLFIFRFLWGFPLIPVMILWSIWIGIATFLHVIYMFFLGRRSEWLWMHMSLMFVYTSRWNAYFQLIVDERPKVLDFDLMK